MSDSPLRVLLLQLPIPPPAVEPIRGNVPLAAGYLKLFARRRGLDEAFAIDILPPPLANVLGDQGLVEEILGRRPRLVGFTCYVWNIERTLWIAQRVKEARPEVRIVLGGPEITHDNAWVLAHPAVDHAVIGEGEQTFAELLHALCGETGARAGTSEAFRAGSIAGLWSRGMDRPPRFRMPLESLDEISSPYLEGILDAADEQALFLETVRGCAFGCKFCYYPKSYDAIYSVSPEKIAANLRHATKRGAKEIVILDPTLNHRPDFADFLRLLARHNPDHQWTCFGELRAEGIDAEEARLLREAGFTEVEIGLQSLDPRAQELMGRKVNLKAFERGAKAMLDEGLTVRVDLILGLPGDTPDSVRRSIQYLHQSKLYCEVQVFNLSILPGTAFREEAQELGLEFQTRPPYYVLQTPALSLEQLYDLMEEAEEAFGLEFDPFPSPLPATSYAPLAAGTGPIRACCVDLDGESDELPPAGRRAQAFALHLRSADFDGRRERGAQLLRRLLEENPHTSLDVFLEPVGGPSRLTRQALATFLEACFASTSYLDMYYSLHPNRLLGAKRLVVVLSFGDRGILGPAGLDQISQYATIV
jgi:radical SAM superfamily enzyme YgiQ (UPF0313 family)